MTSTTAASAAKASVDVAAAGTGLHAHRQRRQYTNRLGAGFLRQHRRGHHGCLWEWGCALAIRMELCSGGEEIRWNIIYHDEEPAREYGVAG